MLASAKKIFDRAFWESLRPAKLLTLSEWADAHRLLSATASSEPGRWRTARTPYLKEIMDCLSTSSPVERVVFKKGSQIGGSECGFNWIGYVIDFCPGPMLMVQPTVTVAERNSKQRIDPMIDSTPRLANKVNSSKSRDASNTILSKLFPNGILIIGGANSAASLSNMPARYIFLDEVDRYPTDVDGEGNPISLALARSRTFARRKILEVSTPTDEQNSRIDADFKLSDQRYYHVPCPHCSHKQVLRWDRIKWPKGEPRKAVYVCAECEKEIEEHHKTDMLAAGEWIAANPGADDGKIAGFHLSGLYSPIGWFSWGEAAALYEESMGNPEKLKAFVNTFLGEVWKSVSDRPDWKRLYDCRESFEIGKVPPFGVLLTAGADVQKDRIEVQIKAWGPDESWTIDYRVILGDTSTEVPWEGLDELLRETFDHPGGSSLRITKLAIDSGYNTQKVYNWARKYPLQVLATKGFDDQPTLLGVPKYLEVSYRGTSIRRGIKMWPVGTNIAKSELYGYLSLEKPLDGQPYPKGYCHFPEFSDEFFRQLTAEELVREKDAKGYDQFVWKKTRERNEALDTHILARVAAVACGIDRLRPEHWLQIANRIGATLRMHTQRKESSGSDNSEQE